MKAMILAAGEGRRMRPLTLTTPKPLLAINGKSLIEHHIARLKALGIVDIIINIAYLGHVIQETLASGEHLGVNISYSEEAEPLETAGAIAHALPLLGEAPFLLVNGDIWTDHPFTFLNDIERCRKLAHLVLVSNPEHNPNGDFCIQDGLLKELEVGQRGFTFSGISLIHPDLIKTYPNKRDKFALAEVFRWAMQESLITAELYHGVWTDVGTPERLQILRRGEHVPSPQ